MAAQIVLRGTLDAHSNWVTAIATSNESPDLIISSSRGECLQRTPPVWRLSTQGRESDAGAEDNERPSLAGVGFSFGCFRHLSVARYSGSWG
jgi:hypothetical protein